MWEKHSQALAVFDDGQPRVMCPCVFPLHILNPHAAPLFWESSLRFFHFRFGWVHTIMLIIGGILDPSFPSPPSRAFSFSSANERTKRTPSTLLSNK